TIVGLAAISIRRVQVASADQTGNFARARLLAFSAAEHAVARLGADGVWRETYDGVTVQQDSGGGTFSWQVIDPVDGDLTDDGTEAAQIVATGTFDGISYTLTLGVTIVANSYAMLANEVEVKDGKIVTVSGALLACNTVVTVKKGAVLNANVRASSVTLEVDTSDPTGVINGSVNTLLTPIDMPASGLFDT
ncbi:unnamed protein product, partial [marine sediment metagenome]